MEIAGNTGSLLLKVIVHLLPLGWWDKPTRGFAGNVCSGFTN